MTSRLLERMSLALLAAATLVAVGAAGSPTARADGTTTAPTVNSTVPPSTSKVTVSTGHAYYPGSPTFDAYLPNDDRTDRPALILVHGGGWQGGDQSELAPYAQEVAEKRGWAAFTVNYRVAETAANRWPDALHDVQAAIRAIAADAASYGVDPAKVVLLGDSAGANLVALVSSVGTADPVTGEAVGVDPSRDVPILAVALWSPPTDLSSLVARPGQDPPACGDNDACDYLWSGSTITDYVGCMPETCPDTYRAASPISHVSSTTAPTFVANSTEEVVPLDQVQAYVDALDGAGVPTELKAVDGKLHASQLGAQVWPASASFLADHIPGESTSSGPGWLLIALVVLVVVVGGVLALVAVQRRGHST
jgi:acetyl esterase/lipase